MAIKGNNQTVGNAGLFFVCHQLSKLGWNVLPTSRNAKGIDIVAYPSDSIRKSVSIQVKALSKLSNVQLGKEEDGSLADYFVICVGEMKLEAFPECFIFTNAEATSPENTRVYDGKYWLQRKSLKTGNNWDKIRGLE